MQHGIHLHLECSSTLAWNCNTFFNPSTVLGIPNVRGTIIHFGGTPPPPPPPTPTSSENYKKWGWFMNNKKVRFNL